MLIAVEGLPGAGKSTQGRALHTHLSTRGVAAAYLPDNLTRDADPLGQALLRLFDSGDPFSRHGDVITDTLLAAAIRADTVATHIAGPLADGTTVIEDRGLHTLYSYSLAGLLQRHHADPAAAIGWLHHVGVFAGRPADRSLWLCLPPAHAITRAEHRQGHPYTGEQRAFLHYVHDAYTALAAADPTLHVVDVSGLDTDDTHQAVLAAISDLSTPDREVSPAA